MNAGITDETRSNENEAMSSEPTADRDHLELEAQVELLLEENRRLRGEYARARRSQYRYTAVALSLIGVVAVVGGLVFPDLRTILLALGGTGLFAGVVTYYLTPERLVPVSLGEAIYSTSAANLSALAADLGLSETQLYVPTGEDSVRLFIPQYADFEMPASADLASGFVITDAESERGLALVPIGEALFTEFERALTGPLGETPTTLGDQLADALVEQFELTQSATPETNAEGRLTVGLTGHSYGAVDRPDHPIVSLLATGVALGLDKPVTVEVQTGDDRYDAVVTVRALTETDTATAAE